MGLPAVITGKVCIKCGIWKPFKGGFNKNRKCRYGYQTVCKGCRLGYDRKRYEANKERIAKYKRQWNEANKERIAEYSRQWAKANPEKKILASQRRCALKAAATVEHFTADQLLTYFEANYGGQSCIYCGTEDNPTVDHLIPLSRGGAHSLKNLAPACLSCNCSKGAKTPEEFLEYLNRLNKEAA